MDRFQVPVDKIREIIGSQGKVINDIIAKCDNCSIDINDDGRVIIYHTDREMINKAKGMIESIVKKKDKFINMCMESLLPEHLKNEFVELLEKRISVLEK